MIYESMDRQDEMYLAFHAGRLEYVLPLSDVGQVVADVPEDMQMILLPDTEKDEEESCFVIFQDDQGLLALSVGGMTGLVQIPSSCQFEIPAEARSSQNSWIAGAAFLRDTGGLCYLLDCRKLRKRFCLEKS